MFDLPCLHVTVLGIRGGGRHGIDVDLHGCAGRGGVPMGAKYHSAPKYQPDHVQILNVH